MTALVQTLEEIRNEYAHERNAYLVAPFGEANRYALLAERAQKKVDALNQAILIIEGATSLQAAE